MLRATLRRTVRLMLALLTASALIGCVNAAAQTETTLTPAQQRAQAAQSARAARQAAAQQAAANRAAAAEARKTAAQNKTTPQNKVTPQNNTLGNSSTRNGTNPLTNTTNNTAASATRPGAAPGSTTTPGTTQRTASPGTGSAGTVGSGTLAWQTRVYSSTGCTHNGNSAVCTFTFSNQGNEATLVAGSEMSGIQLVDDAHVPHHANAAHFLDKYGTQQPRLLVQPGDTGTYVLTFPDVNSQVSSADFHLRQQIVGGITFGGAASGSTGAAGAASTPARQSPGTAGTKPR